MNMYNPDKYCGEYKSRSKSRLKIIAGITSIDVVNIPRLR